MKNVNSSIILVVLALFACLLSLVGCATNDEQAGVRDWNRTYEARAAENAASNKPADDRMMAVTHDDRQMNAAIAKARKTLAQFWTALDAPAADEKDFFLKVGLMELGQTEFVWVGDIHTKDGKRFGTIRNTVETLMNFREGDEIAIPDAQIADWKFRKNGRSIGAFTVRVMIQRLPKAEAEEELRFMGWR